MPSTTLVASDRSPAITIALRGGERAGWRGVWGWGVWGQGVGSWIKRQYGGMGAAPHPRPYHAPLPPVTQIQRDPLRLARSLDRVSVWATRDRRYHRSKAAYSLIRSLPLRLVPHRLAPLWTEKRARTCALPITKHGGAAAKAVHLLKFTILRLTHTQTGACAAAAEIMSYTRC